MNKFDSLPTVESANLDRFWDVIRKLDPELYLIKIALQETGVNPMVLPKVVRQISNLWIGTKFGKVTIYMQNGKVTTIEGIESDRLEEEAVVDRDR